MSVPSLRRLVPVALALAALCGPASAAADVSGRDIVGFLNAQRAAHGFPADIAEDPALSDGCARHNRYSALNRSLDHREDPAQPGYSVAGDAAARTSVLYQGTTWTASANPFETAPIHLHQLLSPQIDRLGASENEGYGCASTLASLGRPPAAVDTLYTYPGDGTRGWRTSEVAREGPFTPGQTVGLAQGITTGPTLYVLASGPGVAWSTPTKVVSASLTGPAGPVTLLTFDRTSPQVGQYLPAGAQLLPRSPLAAGTTYRAALRLRVSTTGGDREFTRSWSFTTAGPPAATTTATALAPSAGTGKACTTRLKFGGFLRTAAGARRLTVRATVCRREALRVQLRRRGRVVLTRTVTVFRGERVVRVTVPRSLAAGRYGIRVTMGGATLAFDRTLPARR
ncbi:hypothetical protein DSM112329_00702 [Paraconexibacter sp. AEG42_29]|uniref:SCP domain-containing protein n=1 Tax=Paraconexibacter sp. AEG42_29 TaxID=2997339 RepID=A0AAU7AQM9_9ACTN